MKVSMGKRAANFRLRFAAAAEFVKKKLGRVDVLCQTAAVLHVKSGSFSMAPETSIARLDEHAMMKAYRVNAMGPTSVSK